MTIDTDEEFEGMKRIGRIVGLTIHAMQKAMRPGMTTAELDDIGRKTLAFHGARSAPEITYDFPGATCISVNDEAAHGVPGERVLEEGDLVNVDVSAELDGFYADSGASFSLGVVSEEKLQLLHHTQMALDAAISKARAGGRMNRVGQVVEKIAAKGGFTIIRNLGGHGIGRKLHDQPEFIGNFYNRREKRRFKRGSVLTLEPFLSTGANVVKEDPDGWTLRTPDGSLSAQFEHTMIVTGGEPIVLTARPED